MKAHHFQQVISALGEVAEDRFRRVDDAMRIIGTKPDGTAVYQGSPDIPRRDALRALWLQERVVDIRNWVVYGNKPQRLFDRRLIEEITKLEGFPSSLRFQYRKGWVNYYSQKYGRGFYEPDAVTRTRREWREAGDYSATKIEVLVAVQVLEG